jgi:7-cyano-7-deazaguanine synthase in queuosine biosynthesis
MEKQMTQSAPKRIVILYSGGLDSLIMRHWAKVHEPDAEIILAHFDIGQPYSEKEFKALPAEVDIRKVDWLRSEADLKGKGNTTGNIYIPGRNMTLASLAASIYVPDEIWMGALKGEMHDKATDKNLEFRNRANYAFKYVFSPFEKLCRVSFPLGEAGLTKLSATKWYLDNGGSIDAIVKSSSCLSGEPGNCGLCHVCVRRWGIAYQLGYVEREQFNVHPMHGGNRELITEMLKGDASYYDADRRSEIVPAVLEYYAKAQLPGGVQPTAEENIKQIIAHQDLIAGFK